jgi:hypothetical protein
MGHALSSDEVSTSHIVDRELEDLRKHASDVKVASGFMRGVLRTAQRSPANTARFLAVMLSLDKPATIISSPSPYRRKTISPGIIVKQHDDAFRHPLAQLIQRAVAANTVAVGEMALQWIDFILVASQPIDTDALLTKDESKSFELDGSFTTSSPLLTSIIDPNQRAASDAFIADQRVVALLESHGIASLFLHLFEMQENSPLSASTTTLLARLVRTFSASHTFLRASLKAPVGVMRALNRLRFARANSEERYSLVDFIFHFVRCDAADALSYDLQTDSTVLSTSEVEGKHDDFVVAHDGAVCLAIQAGSQLPLAIDSLLSCTEANEYNLACVGRALRSLTFLCRGASSSSSKKNGLPFSATRLERLFAASHRGPSTYRDVAALACLAIDYDPEFIAENTMEIKTTSLFAVDGESLLAYPVEAAVHDLLGGMLDVKFIERGEIDPLNMLQLCDTAHATSSSVQGFVLSKNFATVIEKCSQVAIRVPKGTMHWLRLVARISADASVLANPFASAGGLDVLLGIVESATSRQHVYDAVSAIQRLCMTDASRIRLLQQRNFHALLRTISPKGSGEQMIAALEAVSILRSMMTESVLRQADPFLIDAIHSLLCQALAHCPLVNPRTRSVDTAYIVAAQSVLQSIIELLLARARTSPDVARIIYHQLPLDRIRELIQQQWYPVVQHIARELALVMTSHQSQKIELLDFQIISIRDVLSAPQQVTSSAGFSSDLQRSTMVSEAASTFLGSMTLKTSKLTLDSIKRRWKRVMLLRKLSTVRVSTASLFKTVFLQYNELVEAERKSFDVIRGLFDVHVNKIVDQYRERELLEDDALQRTSILLPELAERSTIQMWFTEDFEVLKRGQFIASWVIAWDCWKDCERLEWLELSLRTTLADAQRREHDAFLMRHVQGARAIERLYDQRRHLQSVEERFRSKISDERDAFDKRTFTSVSLVNVQVAAFATRKVIHAAAMSEFIVIRRSLYPVLLSALERQEDRRRDAIYQSAARIFAASSNQLAVLALQREEEDIRQREERWAFCAIQAFSHRYYTIAIRQCQHREQALRIRLWHAFSVQWFEIAKTGVTLPLQANEAVSRVALISRAQAERLIIKEALRATLLLALQATEVRARRALENVFAVHCRSRCFDLLALRLGWIEQQRRNFLALQWYTTARDIVVPLSVLRLSQLEEHLWKREIETRSTLMLSEWHAFGDIKFDFVTKSQTVIRRQILAHHKVEEDALLSTFVSSTHVLAIQHAAKGFHTRKG